MPAKEYPHKRPRTESTTTKAKKFANASEIRFALRTDNQDGLIEALATLRNQLTIKSLDETIAPADARLDLVKQWMQSSPGAHDLFSVWDSATLRQSSLIALILSVLSSVLTLLSAHYTDHVLGQPVMKALLVPSRFRQLNSYIGGSHNDLIIMTLKLYNVMSNFAGGHDRKAVLEGFGWEIKSLPKLLNMRRKTHGENDTADPLSRPDIRTLYVLFLLSFLDVGSSSQVKTAFLEQHREPFLVMFKGLMHDHYSLARKILEVCWAGIWSDSKIKRTLKVGLFNETTLGHLFKLYERSQSEGEDDEHIPANLVHHFLLAICTRPGVGICFKDRGWYPREVEGEDWLPKVDDDIIRKNGKVYNKILANILKTLKVNEDSRQQELAIKILSACPELVAGYWPAAALTLEPRLSSKWIANIAVFGNIISLPVPISMFFIPTTQLYQPTPPPLSAIIENILPSVGTKNNFSKGLQSPSGMVQHCTALALAKCLNKYRAVYEQLRSVASALEESEEDGQWNKRCAELDREVRRRVPEFQVIIGFSQQKHVGPEGQLNQTKVALLAEAAQRLLWLYHRCLPAVVVEARFDVGKLLHAFSQDAQAGSQGSGSGEDDDEDELPHAASRLYRVRQLHVLSLLKDSDQFIGIGKIASLPHTPFRILLNALTTTPVPTIRTAIVALLQNILSRSILFQEDAQEPDLWLKALPSQHISPSDVDTIFHGEVDGLIVFLDDCVHRCLKTPYRYVEALHVLGSQTSARADAPERLDMYPSPLIMTVMEQLDAKVHNKSLPASHLLGIIAFTRKVLVNLSCKTLDMHFLHGYTRKFDEILVKEKLAQYPSTVYNVIRRELEILSATLLFSFPSPAMTVDGTSEIEDHLAEVENATMPENQRLRTLSASRLINHMRMVRQPLVSADVKRLAKIVGELDPSMLSSIAESIVPCEIDLWGALDLTSAFSEYHRFLPFNWLYIHSGITDIQTEACQTTLVESLFLHKPALYDLSRAICLIIHGIAGARQQDQALNAHFCLLAKLFTAARALLMDLIGLKEMIFVQSAVVKDILVSPTSARVLEGLQSLLGAALEPSSEIDRKTVATISNHWFAALNSGLENQSSASLSTACIWVKYLEHDQLFDLLDFLERASRKLPNPALEPINVVLEALSAMTSFEWQAEVALIKRLPQLLSLKSILPDSPLLEQIIAIAVEAALPIGLDGCLFSLAYSSSSDSVTVVRRAESRWSQRGNGAKANIDIHPFLNQGTFSDFTAKIISCLVYQQPSSRLALMEWLKSDQSSQHEPRHLVPILNAFFDASSQDGTAIASVPSKTWLPFMAKIVQTIADIDVPTDIRIRAQHCLLNVLSATTGDASKLLDAVAKEMKHASRSLSHELITAATTLAVKFGSKAESIVSSIIDNGLQWCIDQFAVEQDTGYEILIRDLTLLIKASSISKSHLVDTLLQVVIQNRISHVDALHLALACLPTAQLKPLIVNRHLQAILQHSQFYKLCSLSSSPEIANTSDAIIELLHSLFHLHPHNTCQITHIQPLIRVYRGTLSKSDLRILSIFQLFEGQRKLSVTPLISRWSATPNTTSETALEAIQSLDPILVLRTCLNFPRWRRLDDQSTKMVDFNEAALYDPTFLMLLFSHMLTDQTPASAFGWIELFRSNVVSLFIRALSAKDGQIRDLALCQIVGLWRQMQNADLQEKPNVVYILDLLKDLMPTPTIHSSEYPRQLPTYTALLLMHALRAVFNPSNLIYPLTARFLLQRPTLDTADVPMLYGMLYSSSDDHWKKERAWMIKFLGDGMVGSEDWRILKRRHTWDLLASLFQSADGVEDTSLRLGILEILANLTCNAQAATSLILKSALLPWIEMQLLHPKSRTEGVEWIKILENILVIVDAAKVEASTNGEWRTIICRCLMSLLDDKETFTTENFPHTVPVILRLASLDGSTLPDLPSLLNLCVKCVERLESNVKIYPPSFSVSISELHEKYLSLAPHRSLSLHQRFQTTYTASEQAVLLIPMVEMLWRVSISIERKCDAWDKLTPRVILWRSIYGAEDSGAMVTDTAEWARKEVVRNVNQSIC
ncbi:hypothetical protein HYPSUDRAFT_87850 [Hypholoma sublateritium FD-334 SS-4]|uniref:Nucleolar pre-ribosomal-associated protein 1 C-terminal domain-containing protein n=1 Tax=Hypholoma sublateritium (strain FD-334 SS-4) TaxID=945553 RepID=A0A0D2PNZ3_HYPSF|nr:hypothetical protein HYPSUDRAFT_87850 [Hypholoma sublateritium FD-334 SS-4]